MSKLNKNILAHKSTNSTRSKRLGTGGKDATNSEVPPMVYIYARVSTEGQTTANQVAELVQKYPSAELVLETASGVKSRPMLLDLIERLRPGEVVYAYSLDRLGRSTKEIIRLIESILAKGAKLELKREGASYDSAMGKMVLQMMAAVAEMERNLISERTKTALQARKAKGVKLGRPRVLPDHIKTKALAMLASGMSIRLVAKSLQVSKSTVQKWADEASRKKPVTSND